MIATRGFFHYLMYDGKIEREKVIFDEIILFLYFIIITRTRWKLVIKTDLQLLLINNKIFNPIY